MISYNPKNWLHVLLSFPQSRVFTTLFLDVVGIGVYSAVIVRLSKAYPKIGAPLGPSMLSLLGIILGLLLVFRTNSAYDRWWEGRKLWGQLTNMTRAFARQLAAQLPADADDRREAYARLLKVFPAALTAHLRRDPETPPDASMPRPGDLVSAMIIAMHGDVREGNLPRQAIIALTPLTTAFDDIMGACERIRKTPIPLSYSSYIKQFVVLFAVITPFALAREFGYGTVIASMCLFFSTMGIELLATEIEEPFGTDPNDLPLDEISANIAAEVTRLMGQRE